MKQSKVVFNKTALFNAILNNIAQEQTNKFVAYADEKMRLLGSMIQAYGGRNHMDRTGNLLDSLCWGVVYNGELKDSGFYREQSANNLSYLHEWFPSDVSSLYPVYGHGEAEEYIRKAIKNSGKGWKVFLAILAPYWGYWEIGFTMRSGGRNSPIPRSIKHISGSHIMSNLWDKIRMELKPAKVNCTVHVEKYQYRNKNYFKKGIKKPFKTARRFAKNSYAEKKHFARFPKFRSPKNKK